ncbi:hypothetical protein MKW94_024441, partial [Papaver nudicaule]|nr:hypothetical protein [Papaver nudicaule]
MIRNRVISLLGLRSRSIRPSVIPVPWISVGLLQSSSRVSTSLSGVTEKEKIHHPHVIPPFPEAEFQRALREFLEINVKQFPPPPFDLGAKFTHPDKAIMAVL